MITKLVGTGALLAVLSIALPACAQVSVGIPNASVNIGASVTPAASVKANATGSTASSASSARGSSSVGASASTSVRGSASVGALGVATGSGDAPFSLSRKDVSASSTSYIAPASVASASDLSAYARSLMVADENVQKVSSSDDEVSIWYDEPVKFLGIVPVNVGVQATVDATGTVSVSYPWWYGMFVKEDSAASLQSDLEQTAGVIARGEETTTFSSSAKARLLNALYSIMKSRYEASYTATTSANVTAY